jgi:hypothetical protein
MQFDKIFDPSLNTSKLSYLFFKYYNDVDESERKEYKDVYSKAYRIAENREVDEALNGIMG